MKKVNLFVIGAAKSGTTALYHYFDKHPDIFMCPVKEPHYFSNHVRANKKKRRIPVPGHKYHSKLVKDSRIYHSLFKNAGDCKYLGEASPSYLWDSDASVNIHRYNPEAMIIAILRNPIERAYSHYKMSYRLGLENESTFISALKKDDHQGKKVWGTDHLYIELGYYYSQLKRYVNVFPENQIKIIKSDDLKASPIACLNEISTFLNISNFDSTIFISEKNTNIAKEAKYNWVRNLRNSWISHLISSVVGKKTKGMLKGMVYKRSTIRSGVIDSESKYFLQHKYENELNMLREEFNIEFET